MINLNNHQIVSKNEWIKARKVLLQKEKEFTELRDQLSQQRRDLPWVAVDKEYVFDGPNGKQNLSDLFDGRSHLIVYHFMYGPNWDAGCPSCSFWADNFNDIIVHLNQRDVTMIAVSRAPYNKIDAYKKRMGWDFNWVSSFDTDFNYDYFVSFTSEELTKKKAFYNFILQDPRISDREGVSVFYKDPSGKIFHTYSTYERGLDILNTAYNYLDLLPKGRDEDGYEFPMTWVRRHDEYNKNNGVDV
ncbi:MAG TPA: thioredoxin family protein [Nitrososphaeraceae archaeon]|nr:thioredoxin family protein [Nitrososphaeraceae archaeon]